MRLVRFALELRMKLARNVKGMVWQFDNLDELAVRSGATESELRFQKPVPIRIVKFVAMTMAFVHHECSIVMRGLSAHRQLARLRTQAHRAALLRDAGLFVQHGDDRVRRRRVKLSR